MVPWWLVLILMAAAFANGMFLWSCVVDARITWHEHKARDEVYRNLLAEFDRIDAESGRG